jgi:Kdo2-lipid IVA lauroyltransferase/acyltransferase
LGLTSLCKLLGLTQRHYYFILFQMAFLFRWCAKCPLFLLHSVGALMGWLAYSLSPTYRRRFQTNSEFAGYTAAQVRSGVAHAGRMVAELPRLWLGAQVPIRWTGEDVFEAAHAHGRGIIFLTPHLGCFEITAQAIAQRYTLQGRQINVLYRPARQAWLQTIMKDSRNRPGMHAVPATLAGVKALVKALRRGEALGMLPDQVPPQGLGVWAAFFGQPAYTMTLPAKLAQQTGAQLVLVWGERLPGAQGFAVHFSRFEDELIDKLNDDLALASQQINLAMERLVRQCPQQYLWGYARYKQPRLEALRDTGVAP